MQKPRLNLFALPSQTAILFWLTTATLLGAMMIGLTGAQIIPMWPLVIILLLLPLREFVMRPDREIHKERFREASTDEFPTLLHQIEANTKQLGLKRLPRLYINEQQDEMYVMGSFRRWFLVMSATRAKKLEDDLRDPKQARMAEVQILHELYHFKNGDYWQLGYLAELFKVSFSLMVWFFVCMVGWMILLILAKDAVFQLSISDVLQKMPPETRPVMEPLVPLLFPSQEQMEILETKARGINLSLVLGFVANISVPYVLLASILWLFFRPLLWRMREFYADAGVVYSQRSATPYIEFVRSARRVPLQTAQIVQATVQPHAVRKIQSFVESFWHGDFWPDFAQRLKALKVPETVFYDWKKIAVVLGALALLLEVFLATPLAMPVYGENPMVFPTLVGTAGLAYFLLPQVVLGQNAAKNAWRILIIVLLARTLWLCLTLAMLWVLYLIQPEFLQGALQSAITSTARYAGNSLTEIDLQSFLVQASILNILQVPIIFIVQTLSISGLLFLFRRILYWYSLLRTPQRFQQIIFWSTFWLLFILAVLVMPVSMALLRGDLPPLALSTLGLLASLAGSLCFYIFDRRYYQICPSCSSTISGLPYIGSICPQCQAQLLPWLVVEHEEH